MNRVKPTAKQAKALTLIREGVKPTIAMKQAGYSDKTSEAPSQNLLRSAGAVSIFEEFKDEYLKLGITPEYMAKKTKEWLDAKKIHTSHTEPDRMVPDYLTQIKAAELYRKDIGMDNAKDGPNVLIQQNFSEHVEQQLKKYEI